jgi:DNA (cytosine-5)-methyltransferase 1
MNVKQVHVRVEDELYEKLNSYSAATDQTIQDCVREAVACYGYEKKTAGSH